MTFLLRVILILCVLNDKWIDFGRDYPLDMPVGLTAMFALQFLVYNFVPYITLMYMHYKNFTEPKVKQLDLSHQIDAFPPVHISC